jgi:multidrug transporter EmrE-like cation transporter
MGYDGWDRIWAIPVLQSQGRARHGCLLGYVHLDIRQRGDNGHCLGVDRGFEPAADCPPQRAYVNFGLAGFIHFFVGWTFLSISQKLVGASRTGALVSTAPLFAFFVGILVFDEFLSLPVISGIVLVIAGVYLVSNG